MFDNEQLVLCDLITYKSKEKDKKFYVIVIYSSLTKDIERVFIDEQAFNFFQENKNCDLHEFFARSYNVYNKTFTLKYVY